MRVLAYVIKISICNIIMVYKILDLFSGTGSFSKVCSRHPQLFKCTTLDIEPMGLHGTPSKLFLYHMGFASVHRIFYSKDKRSTQFKACRLFSKENALSEPFKIIVENMRYGPVHSVRTFFWRQVVFKVLWKIS